MTRSFKSFWNFLKFFLNNNFNHVRRTWSANSWVFKAPSGSRRTRTSGLFRPSSRSTTSAATEPNLLSTNVLISTKTIAVSRKEPELFAEMKLDPTCLKLLQWTTTTTRVTFGSFQLKVQSTIGFQYKI